ncbi:aminoacyl-histidine dipeptidase [Prevotella sp. DNF00663]|uniref:aminoacyl-histidine dipeptidase n=1 Tax=Prevotella sp. DNF00663 TaxID=1384078 RepID=UPI0007858B9D|nr:aminoacyl-histidine dipeptidase [Prevotella sp. DNF00663]
MSEIRNLDPKCIWENFYALTQVPRPSGHLEKIQAFLLDFAKRVGVEAFQDEAGNIIMRKPATPGMEDRKGIILQAHMDMVPQKAPESNHNFETDPIETRIVDGWVYANNTTLGSDNGMGVATIMAVMEAKDLQHGPVEGLITADEETGMFGANDLKPGVLKGDILLNLDSESWGKFVIGSAGGIDVTADMGYQEVATDKNDAAVKVTLSGLRGGHSGLEIHEGRGNANKLMVRFVRSAISECDAHLATWQGGNMRNAIPFKAEVVLTLPKENVEALKELVADWCEEFNEEYKGIEKDIMLVAEDVETPEKEVPVEISDNLVNAIYACHNGVMRMIPAIPEVVETSSNLAIINIGGGNASFKILARSSNDEMKECIAETLESCFNMAGMKVTMSGSYSGWNPNPDSETLNTLLDIYKEQNKTDGIVQVDHAGLECSIILGKYPHLDVVSLGPTIRSPHTATERCEIATVAPFWNLLKEALKQVGKKK